MRRRGLSPPFLFFSIHFFLKMKYLPCLSSGAFALLLSIPIGALAAEPVLAEAGTVTVTAADIQGDALRIPSEFRSATLARPEAVRQLANNLVVRRALAAEAEAAGLLKDPATQSALQISKEKFLSDLLLARMDEANKPKRQVLEAIALTHYKANPKRFDLPEQRGASHILIKRETPDASAKAAAILQELKEGADFASLARQKSEDNNANDGGYLGYFAAGQMVPEFDAAVRKMQEPGELSGVVETQFGYHIIKYEGSRPAGLRPFEQVKELLMREAEGKILEEKRFEQIKAIQERVKINQAAIEAFAKSYK